MSKPIDDGGPAQDMALRDAIAIGAMAGILADPNVHFRGDKKNDLERFAKAIAKQSFSIADAMLAERKKGQP